MGSFEWPCPRCGNGQKAHDETQVGRLCAACEEKFQAELADLREAKHLTKAAREKKERDIYQFYRQERTEAQADGPGLTEA